MATQPHSADHSHRPRWDGRTESVTVRESKENAMHASKLARNSSSASLGQGEVQPCPGKQDSITHSGDLGRQRPAL